jgi:hypothetical protein
MGLYGEILAFSKLPKPAEQADNLLLWLGETAGASEDVVTVEREALQAIIGGQSVGAVDYIANHLRQRGLIWYDRVDKSTSSSPLQFLMNFDGWQQFEILKNKSSQSRVAFMAMQYGEAELDSVVAQVFRPAVAKTGFELQVLTDMPRAGLIDDRLRVEIRRSHFLIADVTHRNPGAYWEAGFAEGLGKHVIYTCKKEKFAEASHFDTNHHLTVMWDSDFDKVGQRLKETIRATLPAEAKLDD